MCEVQALTLEKEDGIGVCEVEETVRSNMQKRHIYSYTLLCFLTADTAWTADTGSHRYSVNSHLRLLQTQCEQLPQAPSGTVWTATLGSCRPSVNNHIRLLQTQCEQLPQAPADTVWTAASGSCRHVWTVVSGSYRQCEPLPQAPATRCPYCGGLHPFTLWAESPFSSKLLS